MIREDQPNELENHQHSCVRMPGSKHRALKIQQEQIQAVLNGRAVAIQGNATGAQLDALFEGKAVRLESEPFRSSPPPQKPDLPPSDEVHISLSDTESTDSSTAPDHWMRRGFDLKAILAEISDMNSSRIVLPALDKGKRYDFVLLSPREEDDEMIKQQVLEAMMRDQLGLLLTPTQKSIEMIVVRPAQ